MRGWCRRLAGIVEGPPALAIVALLTLIGLAFRLAHLDGTLLGDELSTAYLIGDRGLADTVRAVSTDAEISPPLYFAVAWLFVQVGSDPEMVRIPALIAGVVSIPLTYLVGTRALSRPAGLIAAAVMALNPFMIFYATDARAYTLAIALLLASTLAMLLAVRGGGTRWWVLYGLFSCLCMYTHYTTAFVLGAQLLWLLWAHPEARRVALLANVGAALAFAPWVPSVLEDFRSPTIGILSDLQGDGFDVKREAVENWAFGYPYNSIADFPGRLAVAVALIALGVALCVGLWRWYSGWRARGGGGRFPAVSRGMVLVVLLMLATPVAELALLGLGGSDLFGARNLNTASGGFALSIGGILAAAGLGAGALCGAAVLSVFAIGATRSLEAVVSTIDFKAAAAQIDREADGDDVVVDMLSPVLTPVPLTPLDAHLPQTRKEFRLYLPAGPPPFLDPPPPPRPILARAVRAASGRSLFLVGGEQTVAEEGGRLLVSVPPADSSISTSQTLTLPRGSEILSKRAYEGLGPVVVYEIAIGTARPG